jgi:hypothetical protein
MQVLPIELKYKIMDFLHPFDIINFSNAMVINIPSVYKNAINKYINESDFSYIYKDVLRNIIKYRNFIDYKVINIIENICNIIIKSNKYMDILGISGYTFNVKNASTSCVTDTGIIIGNMKVINITFNDPEMIKFYIDNYFCVNDIDKENKCKNFFYKKVIL